MDQQLAAKRSHRLREIHTELGVVFDADLTTLQPPQKPPSFLAPGDEGKADSVLRNLQIEGAVIKSQTKGLKRLSTTIHKVSRSTVSSYDELYAALSRVVEESAGAGVLEVLLNRFRNVQGNVNLVRMASTGMLRRIRNADTTEERGRLLQIATENSRLDMVQLLSPLADQSSLDESLHIALEDRQLLIIEVLLSYGANLETHDEAVKDAAKHGDDELLRILLRARKKVAATCITASLSTAVISGSLPCVILFIQAGAEGVFIEPSLFMHTAGINRVDIVATIMSCHNPPSGFILNQTLESVFQTLSNRVDALYPLIEILLCGGPVGDAASNGLIEATLLCNIRLMILLLMHGADINYSAAAAVQLSIQRNRADLLAILLQDQNLKSELASEMVKHIPRNAPPTDKIAILSKLLVNGASGVQCSELLIIAVEQDEIDVARLLVLYHKEDTDRSFVCSVDYNAARCLQIAISRNDLPMLQLLLEGSPSKFSLAQGFSSIPSELSSDDYFSIVQMLLRAGAAGPEVEAAFFTAVSGQHKSRQLINLFVHFGARVSQETLFATVKQGDPEILNALLGSGVSSEKCAQAITEAMKLKNLSRRFKTVRSLIEPASKNGTGVAEISQAVIDIIRDSPNDLPLLSLLCREGKADMNFKKGFAVVEAVKQADPRILEIVLHGHGNVASAATIERTLKYAIDLPTSDASRTKKLELLLRRSKPQSALSEALIKEIKAVSPSRRDLPVIKLLLDAGADVNAMEGEREAAPLCWAVTRNVPELLDLILSKGPLNRSLSLAFPLAMSFQDPDRYTLCEKLLGAGAAGDEISKAFCKAAKEGSASLSLALLLLPQTDVNYKDGLPLRIAVRHGSIELVELITTRSPMKISSVAKAAAFQEAIKLKSKTTRHTVVNKLLKSGMGAQVASEALISAVNASDLELVKVLLNSGASVDHRGGTAIRSAASAGGVEILEVLLDVSLGSKPSLSSLTSGFGGALTIKNKDRDLYYAVLKMLLDAGMRGEAVDTALVHAVREGDSNTSFCELLSNSGASVEWQQGEAVNVAVQQFAIRNLELLLAKHPSEDILKRAYRSALDLPREQRLHTIQQLLKAGKSIDKHVSKTLTMASMEKPADRNLISVLLDHNLFDDGESIVNAAKSLDLRTLTLLLKSPLANQYLAKAFEEMMKTNVLWDSSTGLAIMRLMLQKGASGDAVGEALSQAIEQSENATEDLGSEFLEVLLESGADVNYQHGLALQKAAMQVNIPLLERLLPRANSDSKAMALPYIFTCCTDPATVLEAIKIFELFSLDDDPGMESTFEHPDKNLEPLLFMALDRFPRDTMILKSLLQLGSHANQWLLCENDTDIGMEHWPILLWSLDCPEKRISSDNIETLIDEGANVNFKSKSGMTPLILAIRNQRTDVVAKLISKGANVKVSDPDGTSPLSLASRLGNTLIMEFLLEADADSDDGSLHDAARDLRCDSMRILMKYGHQADYPSDRHEGRSALAEVCLKAVNCQPDQRKIDEAVQCLIAHEADVRLRTPSENDPGKTILHQALDSSDPLLILPVLLKLLWKIVNDDCFLYSDKTHTYSLTKYVEKGIFLGPKGQIEDIVKLLKNKRVVDRYWANSIDAPQPVDYCNAPKHIEQEILFQKARQKRKTEQREDVRDHLDLRRMTVKGEVEIMEIQTEGEIKQEREKAAVERELLVLKARTQLRLEMSAERERERLMVAKQLQNIEHQKALGEVQISTQRTIRQEGFEEDRSRHVMQIEYVGKKIGIENEGVRARLAIEGNALHDQDRIMNKQHERELARIKMQKTLVDKNTSLASTLQNMGMNHRQIGYITGEVT